MRARAALGVALYAGLLAAHLVTLAPSSASSDLVPAVLTVLFSAALHAALCVSYAVVMIRQDHAAFGHVLDTLKWRRIVRTVAPFATTHARQALRVHLRGVWCILWLVEIQNLARTSPADRWEFAPSLVSGTGATTLVNAALKTIVCADLAISFSVAHRVSSWLQLGETWVDLVVSPIATLATMYAVAEPRYALVEARFGYLRMLSLLEPRAYIAALRGLDEVSVLLVKTVVQLIVIVLIFAGFFYEQARARRARPCLWLSACRSLAPAAGRPSARPADAAMRLLTPPAYPALALCAHSSATLPPPPPATRRRPRTWSAASRRTPPSSTSCSLR